MTLLWLILFEAYLFSREVKIPAKKFPDLSQLKFSTLRTFVFLINPTKFLEKLQRDTPLNN